MSGFADLSGLVAPHSIALVGASQREGSLGAVAAANLLLHSKFDGPIHLVTDRSASVLGAPTVPTLDDLRGSVDVTLILLPRAQVPATVAAAAAHGSRFAVIMSSGFGESGDEEGRLLEAEIREISVTTGIRVVGPNCPGLGDLRRPLGMTIQPGFKDELVGGPIGVVAQSGGLTRCILQGSHRGLGFSYFFSPGNQVDLDIADYVHFLTQDDGTEVIAICAESFTAPDRFRAAVQQARAAGKPVVLLKNGRSAAGQQAARSHTGALVGSRAAMDAVAREDGIVLVDEIGQLIDVAGHLATGRRPKAAGVAVFGMSGGAGVMVTDALADRSVPLSRLSAETSAELVALSSPLTQPNNPVDVAGAFAADTFEKCLRAVTRDRDVGQVLVPFNAWYERHSMTFARACVAVAADTDLPIVPIWLSGRDGPELTVLRDAGLLPVHSARDAAAVAAALTPEVVPAVASPPAVDGEFLLEYETKQLLRSAGLPTTSERIASSAEDAIAAAAGIGYPVIAKVLTPAVPHRAGTGLVSGRLDTPAALRTAYRDLLVAAEQHGLSDYSVLVSEFVVGQIESYVGVATDPEWGPLVGIGLGGQWIAEIADAVLVSVPATADRIRTALAGGKLAGVLARYGVPDTVVHALSAIGEALSRLVRADPGITEIDLNPVIISGDRVVVVDALVRTIRKDGAA
ncbi:MAG TPA: acetate--CoA ligase family protein [Pseudonocardiaceae bacterium]|nr:acetate--CoA ligase family protein [Pseudonocardiaceae bacterium]